MPSAPGLLSIRTGWPRACDRAAATIRAVTSVVPPVPKATTARTGLVGYCACARRGNATSTARHRFLIDERSISIPSRQPRTCGAQQYPRVQLVKAEQSLEANAHPGLARRFVEDGHNGRAEVQTCPGRVALA